MTWNSPNPLANPLNQRVYGNYNPDVPKFQRNPNATLPKRVPPTSREFQEQQDSIHVPQSNGVGCRDLGEYFTCADGTILNIRTGKVVTDPRVLMARDGEWNIPSIERHGATAEWNDAEINSLGESDPMSPVISKEDASYWKMAEEESEKIMSNLNDVQKKMLSDLDGGKITKPCGLVDVKPWEE